MTLITTFRRNGRRLLHIKKSKNCLWILLPEEYNAAISSSYVLPTSNFSTLTDGNNRATFLKYESKNRFNPNQSVPKRGMGMFIVRILRGALKIRYLVLGGAIGGGLSLQKVRHFLPLFLSIFLRILNFSIHLDLSRLG